MNALLHVIKNHRLEAEKKSQSSVVETTPVVEVQQPAKDVAAAEQPEATAENCPVIRANQVFLSASNSGRLRVVFF
jgi:hypothetical protein